MRQSDAYLRVPLRGLFQSRKAESGKRKWGASAREPRSARDFFLSGLRVPTSEFAGMAYELRFLIFVLVAFSAMAGMALAMAIASRNAAGSTAREIDFFSPNPDLADPNFSTTK